MSLDNFGQSLFDTGDMESESLACEMQKLRDDFAKFQSTLILNELRVELADLVGQASERLNTQLRDSIGQVNYEIALLSTKICALELKMDKSVSEQVNIDGSARHIMHAVHAQHLVQMGNRKDMSQMHGFPAYPMNPYAQHK
ncbi:hypothetical protein BpHYR1_046846 [Brachionus plicatilis]|uniref:Uncharacterized protein n=1 Tax=Brachionus plicatilis TaxID=10195 RepID=A0A3M7RH55_BRAPC|nr:hypothetical protein BpHYR1_046846 [Brachionus plicatilis]